MANDLLRGRQVVVPLANRSGGAIVEGDVVIIASDTTPVAFTTTTTAALTTDMVGVAIESIDISGTGRICFCGFVPKINLSASASMGDTFGTHTAAKVAAPHSAIVAGDFGEVLGTGATPAALLWGGLPYSNSGNGNVTSSDAVTNGHLAVFDTDQYHIKDGGAVPTGVMNNYICIQDQKEPGTHGGSYVSGWVTRDMNTIVADRGGCASVSSNQMILQSGTYRVRASAPMWMTDSCQAILYNVTLSSIIALGTTEITFAGNYNSHAVSVVVGEFTIDSETIIELRQKAASSKASWGLGYACSMSDHEVYSVCEFWKTA